MPTRISSSATRIVTDPFYQEVELTFAEEVMVNRMKAMFGAALMLGFLVSGGGQAADSCSGYDILVTTYADTKDLGGGMTQSTFSSDSVLTSENSIYHLTTGQCTGTALNTPDGKVSMSGFCARRDKDGDTQSIEWSLAAGADKGVWRSNGGTGKFAGKKHSGWFQNVRADGKMAVSKWGGNCN